MTLKQPRNLRHRLRPWLLGATMVFIIAEIVALSPSSLEEGTDDSGESVTQEELMVETGINEPTLAPGIPRDRMPDYSVLGFHYVSTQNGQKQWRLVAERAILFNGDKLVHARNITANLYDPDGQVTVITGKEARYYMNKRDLEVYGDVNTRFPDGFETHSEYLRYFPKLRKVDIPVDYFVHGKGQEDNAQDLSFDSYGMTFDMVTSEINLLKEVSLTMVKTQDLPQNHTKKKHKQKGDEWTRIESDQAQIFRKIQVTHFTMDPNRPIESRFVRIAQPGLFARSRRADLHYGDFSKILNYMIAYEDVLIREKNQPDSLRYGTGGKAEFNTKDDVIVLSEFPQVYQDEDTIIGDVITLHRDTDIVEVEHSNAFRAGAPSPSPSSSPSPSLLLSPSDRPSPNPSH